jgi:hypothetical protein
MLRSRSRYLAARSKQCSIKIGRARPGLTPPWRALLIEQSFGLNSGATPTEARRGLVYILVNFRKHGARRRVSTRAARGSGSTGGAAPRRHRAT